MLPKNSLKAGVLLTAALLATFAAAQGYSPENYKSLTWTNVGPNRGGRSIACTGVRTRPKEYYFGACGGGLWKSTDAGVTWNCVTDGFVTSASVGAVAVSDSNPDIVYIGMGEREIRGDAMVGDGVYKSTDGGKTWSHVGLRESGVVSRIVVDPKNPEVVYVAALGQIFEPNAERGIFKSIDGGKTWNKVLFESNRAGAVDLVMDPSDPNTLYAATWEAWRTPYMLSSGGPGSKLFKSIDAGKTWKEITRSPGLPLGTIGKIGISVSAADPKRVYAIVEAEQGGIFKSDDGGATWAKTNDSSNYRQRAWYFSHVYADPKVADKVYCLNVGAGRSTDGGKTWANMRTPHSDNHDLWLNPDDPDKMIEANDGGAAVSLDGGKTWTKQNTPTAQMYHVIADNHIPYRIYGAQQDNSSVMLRPDQGDTPEKRNFEGTAGGESGYIAVRTDDPEIVYGGNYGGDLSEIDNKTGMGRQIDPWPDNPMGHAAADLEHRFQWTFPIVTSPHDPNVLYTASQYLLKTTNRGKSWQRISPDLTRNDKKRQASSGGPLTQDNTSVEYYDTIFTVAESPVKKGVIWTGSDDGLVHVTLNGGRSWSDVTPPDMPHWGRVSMIDPSPHAAGTAFVAVNDYQEGDLKPYIYKTHDFGKTWTKITSGIADDAFSRVCREDLHRPGLLYAGTETGVYVSFNDGAYWQKLQQNLPLCPVHDLFLKDDDLIAATHGRSFWIMHGLSRLAELTPTQPTKPLLYAPIDRYRLGSARATVDYYLPAKAKDVKFEFTSRSGEVLATATGDTEPGFHTVSASLSHPGFGTFPGMILWSGFSRPISAPPGTYMVKMTADGSVTSQPFRLLKDPRAFATERELEEQYNLSVAISDRVDEANSAVVRIEDTETQIDRTVTDSKGDPGISAAAEKLKTRLTAIEQAIYQTQSHSGEDPLNYPIRLNDKLAGVLGAVQGGSQGPTAQAKEVFKRLSRQLQVQLDGLKAIEAKDIPAFNKFLAAKSISPVAPKTPPLERGGRRRGGGEEEENERERDRDEDRDR